MVPKGKVDYARYEARRRNIIAMLRATMWQEVLDRVQNGGERVDPYDVGKAIHGWVENEVEVSIEEGFLIKLAWEPSERQLPPTESEIREWYMEASRAVSASSSEAAAADAAAGEDD